MINLFKAKHLALAAFLPATLASQVLFTQKTFAQDQSIVAEELQGDLAEEEAPPAPEYPYPGSENSAYAADPSMVKKREPQVELPRPTRVDEEGNYFYDQTAEEKKAVGADSVQYPREKGARPDYENKHGIEKPASITERGETLYGVEKSPQNASFSLHLGMITPPDIQNEKNNRTFSDMYGKTGFPVIFGDYEWRLTSKVGRLGLKFGSGFMFASGKGAFKDPNRGENPLESYTFVLFPNTLTAGYKFQYADKQLIVPYVEGGAGYWTFAEVRDDLKTALGASPVMVAAGGVNILMDWFDEKAIMQLDSEYGINHIWLAIEYRQIVGLKKDLDFTSQLYNIAFVADF